MDYFLYYKNLQTNHKTKGSMVKNLLILLLLTFTVVFAADNPVIYENPPDGMYFRDWLLCGPFPNPLPDELRNICLMKHHWDITKIT